MCHFLSTLPGHTVFIQRGLAKGKVRYIEQRAGTQRVFRPSFKALILYIQQPPRIATEWQGATPDIVSGIERTRSPTANNADEKSAAGAGRVAAADNKMK